MLLTGKKQIRVLSKKYKCHQASVKRANYLAFQMEVAYLVIDTDNQFLLFRLNLCQRKVAKVFMFVYKLVISLVKCEILLGELNCLVSRLVSRHNPTFYLPQAKLNILYTCPYLIIIILLHQFSRNVDFGLFPKEFSCILGHSFSEFLHIY